MAYLPTVRFLLTQSPNQLEILEPKGVFPNKEPDKCITIELFTQVPPFNRTTSPVFQIYLSAEVRRGGEEGNLILHRQLEIVGPSILLVATLSSSSIAKSKYVNICITWDTHCSCNGQQQCPWKCLINNFC